MFALNEYYAFNIFSPVNIECQFFILILWQFSLVDKDISNLIKHKTPISVSSPESKSESPHSVVHPIMLLCMHFLSHPLILFTFCISQASFAGWQDATVLLSAHYMSKLFTSI